MHDHTLSASTSSLLVQPLEAMLRKCVEYSQSGWNGDDQGQNLGKPNNVLNGWSRKWHAENYIPDQIPRPSHRSDGDSTTGVTLSRRQSMQRPQVGRRQCQAAWGPNFRTTAFVWDDVP